MASPTRAAPKPARAVGMGASEVHVSVAGVYWSRLARTVALRPPIAYRLPSWVTAAPSERAGSGTSDPVVQVSLKMTYILVVKVSPAPEAHQTAATIAFTICPTYIP